MRCSPIDLIFTIGPYSMENTSVLSYGPTDFLFWIVYFLIQDNVDIDID